MVRSRRTAFTLVELLVVITIIGMLMAILLPAVGAATESARAAQCKNRVKQIALAMQGYESRNQAFPGYVDGREIGSKAVPYSWLVALMPDMERQDIYDQYGRSDFEPPRLDFLVCPSDPPLSQQMQDTSYVANAGFSEEDASGCGILHRAFPLRSSKGKKLIHQQTSLDKISAGDGASNTILISENIQARQWHDLPFAGELTEEIPGEKEGAPFNVIVWSDIDQSEPDFDAYKINSSFPPNAESRVQNARPSSEHRGGVNVAFADGHVQFLKDTVEYSVYARLLSTDGKKCHKFLKTPHNGHKHKVRIDHRVIVSDADYK